MKLAVIMKRKSLKERGLLHLVHPVLKIFLIKEFFSLFGPISDTSAPTKVSEPFFGTSDFTSSLTTLSNNMNSQSPYSVSGNSSSVGLNIIATGTIDPGNVL